MTYDTWLEFVLEFGAMFYLHELMKTWRYLKKVSSKVFYRNARKEIVKMRSMRDDTYWCHFFVYGNIYLIKLRKAGPILKLDIFNSGMHTHYTDCVKKFFYFS